MGRGEYQSHGFTPAIWLVTSFTGLTLFVIAGWTQTLDDALNSVMVDAETPWLVWVAEVFHRVGAAPMALPTAVLVAVVLLAVGRWGLAGAWIVMIGSAQALSTVTKMLAGRDRPLNSLVHESSASYPSGHALVSGAAMAIGLALLLGLIWPNRHRLFVFVGAGYAVLMAWSRMYLRAHWFTDVVAGLILGTAMVLIVVVVTTRRSGFRG